MPRKPKSRTKRISLRKPGITLAVLALVASAFSLYSYLSLRAPNLPNPPLKDLAAKHGLQLGMLIRPDRLKDKPYVAIFASQFSFATIDGPTSWDKLRPSPTKYDWAPLDSQVKFAEDHRLPVYAQHLVWDEADSLPKWLKNGNYTKQQLLDIMHKDISLTVGRYKGRVAAWTVVNEAFSRAHHIYGLNDWWGEHLGGGTGWIDDAFRWAHQADPNAKLVLNDFSDETEGQISDEMYAYLKSAKSRGIPISGIGLQMHINAAHPPGKSALIKNMQRFGALGFPVYITEFDINSNSVNGSDTYKAQLEARITADVVSACVESKSCASFNVFGMTDKESFFKWITRTKSRSYLFTSRYQPRPSFYAFRNALL